MKVNGFTIIELMISILILSILATISFSIYQKFYSKSLLTSCLAEISHAKIAHEIAINDGQEIKAADNLFQLNVNSPISCKSHKLQKNKITGFIKDGKDISGSMIVLLRDDITTSWKCSLENVPQTFNKDYLPNECF